MINFTIKILLISLLLIIPKSLLQAQKWSGPNNLNANIWRNGNVGIGINNPDRPFQLRGSNSVLQIDRDTKDPGFGVTRYSPGFGNVWKSFFFYTEGTAPNQGRFIIADWGTQVKGPSTPRLVIGNTGNIGLGGELDPAYPLHINGAVTTGIQYNGPSTGWAGTYMNGGRPFYGYKTDGVTRAYSYISDDDYSWHLLVAGGDRIIVNTDGDTRINGAVGIGTYPPPWGLRVGDAEGLGSRIGFGTTEYFQDGGYFIISVNGTLIPSVGNPFDLGTSANRWRNLYLSGSVITSSDKRLKEDIHELESPLQKVLQLKPVSYALKNSRTKEPHVGLIAQEVLEVMPEIVYDPTKDLVRNEDGGFEPASTEENPMLGIKYMELIPYLVAALQEQDIKHENAILNQENTILALKEELALVKNQLHLQGTGTNGFHDLQKAQLFQNQPNPFDQETKIKVFLPENVQSATLYIYNMEGQELKQLPVRGRGQTEVIIQANTLRSGMYLYALIADNQEVGMHRMIIR